MLESTVEPEAGREPVADNCRPPEHLLQIENSPPDPNSVVMSENISTPKALGFNHFFLNNRKYGIFVRGAFCGDETMKQDPSSQPTRALRS